MLSIVSLDPEYYAVVHVIYDLDGSVYSVGFMAETKVRTAYNSETGEPLGVLPKGARVKTWIKEGDHSPDSTEIREQINVDDVGHALHGMRTHIQAIYREFEGTSHAAFLTGNHNFRNEIYPDYKISRKNAPKPYHYKALRRFLIHKFQAEVCEGFEADDAAAMEAYRCIREGIQYVLVSEDKDLRQIPGLHFSPRAKKVQLITSWDCDLNFFSQVLTGDSTDDIPGLDGVGPVKAAYIMEDAENADDLYIACLTAYAKVYGEEAQEIMHRNATLLHLLRSPDDKWTPPLTVHIGTILETLET